MPTRLVTVMLCFTLAACFDRQPAVPPVPDEVLFTGTLQELAPHHDGDHFIYRATTKDRGSSLQVEHVSVLEAPDEFVVNTIEDGTAMGKMHLRATDTGALLLSEGLPRDDLIIVYEQPLPSYAVPLTTSVQRATSPITLVRASDGKVVARGQVEQTVTARRAAPDADGAFVIYTERSLQLPRQAMRLVAKAWITPGMGEVRSEGAINGADVTRRNLLCAIVAGKRVGTQCDHLDAQATEN